MSEQGVSEKLIREAAWAVWEEIDGPLARASMDADWLELNDREKAEARLRVAFARVLPELEAEWRERLLSDEFVGAVVRWEHYRGNPARDSVQPFDEDVAFTRASIEAALSATQPHSGQPGDQG